MTRTPTQVVREHTRTLEQGDAAAVAADYAQDTVVVTIMGSAVGKEAVEGLFTQLMAGFPGIVFTELGLWAEGDVVLIHWSATSEAGPIPQGVDTFVVKDGLIQRQTAWIELAAQ